MAWMFEDVFGQVREQFLGFFDTVSNEAREGRLAALVAPVDPFNRSELLAPLVSIAGIIGVLLLTGMVVGAMAVTLAGILGICLVLVEVFGYEFDLAMPPMN
jgi:hypothetical protein